MTEATTTIRQFLKRLKRIETVFAVGVFILAIGAISYINNQLNQPVIVQSISGQKQSLPAGWEMYVNKQYGFSIGHHSVFKPTESHATLPSNVAATDRDVLSIQFKTKSNDLAPLSVNVTAQTLDQAVSLAKSNIANYHKNNDKITITKQQSLTVNGSKAIRIDAHIQSANKAVADSDFTNLYISANGLVYNIATQLVKAHPFDDADAQTMYTSFDIVAKKS
jgi:hypothetical protein